MKKRTLKCWWCNTPFAKKNGKPLMYETEVEGIKVKVHKCCKRDAENSMPRLSNPVRETELPPKEGLI